MKRRLYRPFQPRCSRPPAEERPALSRSASPAARTAKAYLERTPVAKHRHRTDRGLRHCPVAARKSSWQHREDGMSLRPFSRGLLGFRGCTRAALRSLSSSKMRTAPPRARPWWRAIPNASLSFSGRGMYAEFPRQDDGLFDRTHIRCSQTTIWDLFFNSAGGGGGGWGVGGGGAPSDPRGN